MRHTTGALAIITLLLFGRIAKATVVNDVCGPSDDPCVLTGEVHAAANSILDTGGRGFRIGAGAKLIWTTALTINADSCDFEPGSTVAEDKDSPGNGYLTLNCGSSNLLGKMTTVGSGIVVEGDGPHVWGGSVAAKGDAINVIAIDSYGMPGGISLEGKIKATAKVGAPPGEFRFTTNYGDIDIADSAKISLKGATADPSNEIVWFEADSGKLTVSGKIDAKIKNGAYEMNFESDGNLRVNETAKITAKGVGIGAKIGFNSQSGEVRFLGKALAPAKAITSNGPKLRFCASTDVIIGEGSQLVASDGVGYGSVVIGAGHNASVSGGAKVFAKEDGDIEVCGGNSGFVSSNAKVDPEPESVGTDVCLSPTSQFIFFLDCNQ